MNPERERQLREALRLLPAIRLPTGKGKNGEELATDEAAVWKRVLNYRIARYLHPRSVLETHPGFGISSRLYHCAARRVRLYDPTTLPARPTPIDLVDIDPFGQPWDSVSAHKHVLAMSLIAMVSNGEAYAVARNWPKAQRFPSRFRGRDMPRWVVEEYLPRMESELGLQCRFFYAFPTTVRSVHSAIDLPQSLFASCPRWMWWLARYQPTAISVRHEGPNNA
jgi:hypothetical protein